MSTRIIDRGYSKLVRELRAAGRVSVEAGFFGENTGSKFNLAQIAAVNEFGSDDGSIPSRSFMRTSFDDNQQKYESLTVRLIGKVIDGNLRVFEMVNTIGALMAGDIKKKITDIRIPSNAPSTIAQKGFDNPLINTGLMRNSVKHRLKLL